ncbi:hypothetical protein H2200_011136 [Cladophialophora chaetospira]|uniref:Uncharacterized protein n=1 Tax=Cladophialophora chaetospira TaxID=386627 RepID=A0AA38X022_9EURO|nr:hypothetical protein H2200_011136 [Cladophialophora chaetospira]
MATFPPWTYPLPEINNNPTATTNISSHFVRPSKVVKPNSRNNSPRNLARRKTTTAVSASPRNRSIVDHLRSTTQWQGSGLPRSRPVSWHPDFFDPSNCNVRATVSGEDSRWGFVTAHVNGLVTPVCYPSMSEPQMNDFFVPLDDMSALDHSVTFENQHYQQHSWLDQAQENNGTYDFASHGQPGLLQPMWLPNQVVTIPNVPTAPSSPACPPLQNIGLDTLSLGIKDSQSKRDADDLVGMGLYDSPAEVQSSSLLFGGFSGSGRKSLKLEESFEPSEQEGNAVEEDDEDGDEADSDEQDEQSTTNEECTERWHPSAITDHDQSVANYQMYDMPPRPEPLAAEYLATLRQMNSTYYPSEYSGYGHEYGWI